MVAVYFIHPPSLTGLQLALLISRALLLLLQATTNNLTRIDPALLPLACAQSAAWQRQSAQCNTAGVLTACLSKASKNIQAASLTVAATPVEAIHPHLYP